MDSFQINYTTSTTLTDVERELLDFMTNSFPDEVKYIDGEDNEPLKLILIAIAKSLGNSRELITNLVKSHDLKRLIQDIADPTLEHIKVNNFKLMSLMLDELKQDIDFNKVNDPVYIDNIEDYFKSFEDSYTTIKGRGSVYGLHNVMRHFSYSPTGSAIIENWDDLYSLSTNPEFPEEVHEIIRDYFGQEQELDPIIYINMADPIHAGSDVYSEDWPDTLFHVSTSSSLYKEIMKIKPAGMYFYVLMTKYTPL